MRKIIFLILFISGSLFAQDGVLDIDKSAYHKILIGLSVSPGYSNIILPNSDNSKGRIYKSQFGYTFGLNFNYNFSKKIGLITGVSWSAMGYRTDFEEQNYSKRAIVAGIRSLDPKSNKSNYYFIGIPLKAIFKMGKGKVRFVGGLGIAASSLIKSTTKNFYEYQNGDKRESASSKYRTNINLALSSAISFGIETSLKNKHLIRVEPNFKLDWFASPLTNSVTPFWTAGINFSYYFGLKKNLN